MIFIYRRPVDFNVGLSVSLNVRKLFQVGFKVNFWIDCYAVYLGTYILVFIVAKRYVAIFPVLILSPIYDSYAENYRQLSSLNRMNQNH